MNYPKNRVVLLAVAAVLITAGFPRIANAQLGVMTVQDALSRFEEHRAGLLSYVAKANVIDYSVVQEDNLHFLSMQRSVFEIVADSTADVLVAVRNDYPYFPASAFDRRSSLLLKRGQEFYKSVGTSGELRLYTGSSPGNGFFDPTSIGLGFCPEVTAFDSFASLLGSYRQMDTRFWKKQDDNDNLVFGLGPSHNLNKRMAFDPAQGFAPIAVFQADGGPGIGVKTRYASYSGIWLPTFARFNCGSRRHLLVEIEWISVNEPIPRGIFDPNSIAKLANLQLRLGGRESAELDLMDTLSR